jgi:plasmid stabilization system protein ParE
MAYSVSLADRAQRDLVLLYEEIHADSSDAALQWYTGLKEAILSLEHHPNRCPVTPESRKLRHLLHGNPPHVYRVIYRVLERRKQIQVLHIRHGARQKFRPAEIGSE